jgi:hypothetical protein
LQSTDKVNCRDELLSPVKGFIKGTVGYMGSKKVTGSQWQIQLKMKAIYAKVVLKIVFHDKKF